AFGPRKPAQCSAGSGLLQSNLVLRLGSAHAAQRLKTQARLAITASDDACCREQKEKPGAHVMSTVITKDGIENMSLVPGRPGHDELVPSRYAQKVGAIGLMVVSDGVLQIPALTIAHNIEPAVRAAWLEHEFLSPEMLEWPLNVAVVRSGDRTILIDAGIGMDPGLDLPQAGRLVRRLE